MSAIPSGSKARAQLWQLFGLGFVSGRRRWARNAVERGTAIDDAAGNFSLVIHDPGGVERQRPDDANAVFERDERARHDLTASRFRAAEIRRHGRRLKTGRENQNNEDTPKHHRTH